MRDGLAKPPAAALAECVRAEARALGFSLVGVVRPDPSRHIDFYRKWLAAGHDGQMRYLARGNAVERRADLAETLPSVRSVVVVGHEYFQEDPPGVPDDPSRGVIARYARGRDYHKVVKKKLGRLGRWLDEEARGDAASSTTGASVADPEAAPAEVRWRAYADTGPILERDLARRAGLGWFGKNTMILNRKHGSYFFLGVLLTDVELEPDPPFEADHCGSCRACLDACPTGALLGRDEDGAPVMDATRCISYLTIEHRGAIPEGLRPLIGNRIYGCDICQEVCPFARKFSVVATERDYAARESWEAEWERDPNDTDDDGPTEAVIPTTDGPSLVVLMRMSEEEWDAYTRGSAMRRAGYSGLRRNVAIAIGNWLGVETRAGRPPDPDAIGELVAALSDEDPVVAEAAAWGLSRMGCR